MGVPQGVCRTRHKLLRLARRRARVVACPLQALGDAHTHLGLETASDDLFISACGHTQADVQWRVLATSGHSAVAGLEASKP